jgi:hypothetical protein
MAPLDNQADRPPPERGRLSLAVVLVAVALGLGTWAVVGRPTPPPATVSPGAAGPVASDGSYTLLDGSTASLASLRGHPVMVWLIAGGCASCAASIPAVAQHLTTFRRSGTRILVLGLYGAFGAGAQGRTDLADFGRAAAGSAFANPAWTWGLASQGLTTAYDPDGVPDAYALLNAQGRVTYENSVPISTMSDLLAHLSPS